MNNTIMFSIVIPTYNQKNFIKSCLDSCFAQTYKNFEILVVDNNSEDGTKEILKSYQDKIKFFTTNNKGIISVSRNIAINQAKGDWIVLLDSDDFFKPNKLEELHSCIKKKF